jgi:hypothetical protein
MMTNVDLIDWTIQEAQDLEFGRREANDPDGRTLNRLLAVLEREPAGPTVPKEPLSEIATSHGDDDDQQAKSVETPDAAKPSEFDLLTSARPVPEAPVQLSQPALLTAILQPDIYTSRFDRDRAIALRWVLRDIKNKRLKWSPVDRSDLQLLIKFGLVEMRHDAPMLTSVGLSAAI